MLHYFEAELGYELVHAPMPRPPIVKVLAGLERIDAWFVRGMSNREGQHIEFDEIYGRGLDVGEPDTGLAFKVPSTQDMIALKRMSPRVRPKDEEEIRYLLVRRELEARGEL